MTLMLHTAVAGIPHFITILYAEIDTTFTGKTL